MNWKYNRKDKLYKADLIIKGVKRGTFLIEKGKGFFDLTLVVRDGEGYLYFGSYKRMRNAKKIAEIYRKDKQ